MSKLKVCGHCRKGLVCRVSSDIVFHVHWVGDFLFFDVDLIVDGWSCALLYREVYG